MKADDQVLDVVEYIEQTLAYGEGAVRALHCTHPEQDWCNCDWCRVLRKDLAC